MFVTILAEVSGQNVRESKNLINVKKITSLLAQENKCERFTFEGQNSMFLWRIIFINLGKKCFIE